MPPFLFQQIRPAIASPRTPRIRVLARPTSWGPLACAAGAARSVRLGLRGLRLIPASRARLDRCSGDQQPVEKASPLGRAGAFWPGYQRESSRGDEGPPKGEARPRAPSRETQDGPKTSQERPKLIYTYIAIWILD